jgi:biopolymer transport protein ExbD
MKMSRRAKRMEKQHKRRQGAAGLNLVALMDIFTILVFFLLVNTSGVQPQGTKVELPQSIAEKVPEETILITVSNEAIVVQGRRVADTASVMAADSLIIEELRQELDYHAKRKRVSDASAPEERPVTIMGDKEIPYKLLKRIMLTCTQTGYSQVSLAVTRKARAGGAAS